MTRKEVAVLYCISESTLRRWLRSINVEACKRRLTPNDLDLIKREFGDPSIYKDFGKQKNVSAVV